MSNEPIANPTVSRILSHSLVEAMLPTPYGVFTLHLFQDKLQKEHLALVKGEFKNNESVVCRVHSECLTSEVFHSLRCDCREQLEGSLKIIAAKGGIFIYLRQEGRDIGLLDKLKAYNLQDKGYDTFEANLELGHSEDPRDYWIAAEILKYFGIPSIQLISNNPNKKDQLELYHISIDRVIPIIPTRITKYNEQYLKTKAQKHKHILGDLSD